MAKRKRAAAKGVGGNRAGADTTDRDAYVELSVQQDARPAGKPTEKAARSYYQSQYYRIGRTLGQQAKLQARADALRALRQAVEGGENGEGGDGDRDEEKGDGEADDDDDGVAGPAPAKRPRVVKINGPKKAAAKKAAPPKPNTNKLKLKPAAKKAIPTADEQDDVNGAHLVADEGDGDIPANKRGRELNVRQKIKEAEEALANGPHGVTLGGRVPDMNTGKKTAATAEVLQKEYPPFTPADGQWDMGWEEEGRHLGTGGQACVFLHRRYADSRVVDRVVVKDSMLSGEEWSCWYKWHPDVRNLDKRKPIEVHCLETLRDKTAPDAVGSCISIRGHRVETEDMWYRLYTGWCQHDSLYSLFPKAPKGLRHQGLDVAEPALWSIFNDLVKGALVLETGGIDTAAPAEGEEKWTPIVHRDLKLANIFLDARPNGAEFASYPRAVYGDFGLAIMSNPSTDAHNPFAYSHAGEGTPGWKAPEQVLFRSRRTLLPSRQHHWKVGGKTNIWGIGAIMIRLMNRGALGADKYSPRYEHGKEELPVLLPDALKGYSEELIDLAQKCCAFDPNDRPNLQELRELVEGYTSVGVEEGAMELDRGLRYREIEEGGEEEEGLRLRFKGVPDVFAVGDVCKKK